MINDIDDDESNADDLPALPDPGGITDTPGHVGAIPPQHDESDGFGARGLPPLPMATSEEPEPSGPTIQPAAPSFVGDLAPAEEDMNVGQNGGDDSEPPVILPARSHVSLAASNEDPFLGKTYGGYQLVEQIGRGGMGMVYRGVQVSLEREVAVKLLNKALVDNDEFIKRFQREARAMASIHHPNIVSVIDFGEQDGVWFMVAEFVEGTNLARMIRDQLMVPYQELIPIAVHCLSGLAHVAKTNVIHRDIKPDNILIDKDGVAKIADFGLAKDMSKDETDLTAAGSAMGTPSYMSPEQCMGHVLDGRSDLYSLGVTLYFALTGEKPFTGRSSFDVMTKQREYQPPPVSKVNPQVPKPVSALVEKMMAKAPNKRPDDAQVCREDWLRIGADFGCFQEVARSGEFLFKGDGLQSAEVAYPDDVAPPPLPDVGGGLSEDQGGDAGERVPRSSDSVRRSGSERVRRPASESARRSVSDGEQRKSSGAHISPARDRRSTTEKKTQGGALTCPKCGTLNRETRVKCEKCEHPFQDDQPKSTDSQVRQADLLFRKGEFRDSAVMYSQLAEGTDDRRQRAVLRAKEREARTKMEEEQFGGLKARLEDLERRKQYKEAESLLVRQQRESSANSVVMRQVSDDLRRIRKAAKRSRRIKVFMLMMLCLIGAGAAAWLTREQWIDRLPFEIPGLRASDSVPASTTLEQEGDQSGVSQEEAESAAESGGN